MLYTPEPSLEPIETKAIGECKYCGDVLYEGEEVIFTDEGMFHDEEISDCFIEYCRSAMNYTKGVLWGFE